jgi:hypothetical protein
MHCCIRLPPACKQAGRQAGAAFFLIVFLPFARNLHNLEPLALTMMITKETQK